MTHWDNVSAVFNHFIYDIISCIIDIFMIHRGPVSAVFDYKLDTKSAF